MTQVAIFTRVSKKQQATDRQLSELKEYAKKQGYQIVATFSETISGSTKNEQRPMLQELLGLATSGQLDKVLVSEVSRLGRSTVEVLKVLEQLDTWRVSVFVLNYHIETRPSSGKPNPMALFMLTMLADLARMEKETMRERIHSGLEEAVRQGKTLGRPKGSSTGAAELLEKHADIVRNLKKGKSIRDVAAITGKSDKTVKTVRKAWHALNPPATA